MDISESTGSVGSGAAASRSLTADISESADTPLTYIEARSIEARLFDNSGKVAAIYDANIIRHGRAFIRKLKEEMELGRSQTSHTYDWSTDAQNVADYLSVVGFTTAVAKSRIVTVGFDVYPRETTEIVTHNNPATELSAIIDDVAQSGGKSTRRYIDAANVVYVLSRLHDSGYTASVTDTDNRGSMLMAEITTRKDE